MSEIESFSYKNYQNKNEYKIVKLFEKTFKRKFNIKKWNWVFKKNPSGKSKITLVFLKNRLVGQCASIKLLFRSNSKIKSFYRLQDVMVDKKYRLKKISTKNLKLFTSEAIKKNNNIIAFPNDRSVKSFLRAGYKIFYIHTYEMLLKTKYKVDEKIIIKNSNSVSFNSKDTDLINNCLKKYTLFNSRKTNYLNWRYSLSYNNYKISRFYLNKKMIGLIVGKFYAKDKSICICELFFNESKNLYSIIKSFLIFVKKSKAKKIKIWSIPYFNFHKNLLNFGFKKTSYKTNICVDKNLFQNKSIKKIFLSMGDSDIY